MAVCEQCGSIRIVRAPSTLSDRFVALLTGNRPFLCRRCGWRGRENWTDEDLRKLVDYGAGGAETDPALGILDAEPVFAERQNSRRKHDSNGETDSEPFDFGPFNFTNEDQLTARESDERQSSIAPHRQSRRRRTRAQPNRRIIVVAIAATALITLVVLALSLGGD